MSDLDDYLSELKKGRPVLWYHPDDRTNAILIFIIAICFGIVIGMLVMAAILL